MDGMQCVGQVHDVVKTPRAVSASIEIIGLIDEQGNIRTALDSPPLHGTRLYSAPYLLVGRILGIDKDLYIGYLHLTKCPVKLSLSKFVRGHTAVIGKTGSGKSYTVVTIIEELLLKNLPVFIVDPHSEYCYLGAHSEREQKAHKYYDASPRSFKVNRISWSADHPIQKQPTTKEYYFRDRLPSRRYGVQDRLSWSHFGIIDSRGKHVALPALLEKGQATILDLKGAEPSVVERTVTAVLTNLFTLRRRREIKPFVLVLEEAHTFAPERGFGSSSALEIAMTIAKESRKFNMPAIFVTQRPQLISKTVLAMCQNWFVFKITNPLDLESVISMCEGTTPVSRDIVRNLETGTGLISGMTESPILVDIRCKRSSTGVSTDMISELSKFDKN